MKKVITFILACAMAASMAACGAKVESVDSGDTSMFVLVETGANWYVFYHRDTKVMYVMSNADYNRGTFTMLVNADGSPMVYQEKDIPRVAR